MTNTELSFDTGDLTLHYTEGEQAGAPLIMLHGLSARRQAWQSIAPHLTGAWHIYAPDLRGHGQSGRGGNQYRALDYAQDVIAFIRGVTVQPAVLIGHSLGALTALVAASMATDQVRALILLDPPIFTRNASLKINPGAYNDFRWVYQLLLDSPTLETIVARCREVDSTAPDHDIQERAETLYQLAPETIKIALDDRLLDGWSMTDGLRAVTCPTLFLYGDWDHGSAVRTEDVAFVQAHLPQVVSLKIDAGTHVFPWEQTALMMQHINSFLASLPAQP